MITLNITMGDWNPRHENGDILAVENWKSMLQRYVDFCADEGIEPVDVTGFTGN